MSHYRLPNPDKVTAATVVNEYVAGAHPARIVSVASHIDKDSHQMSTLIYFVMLDQHNATYDPFKGGRPTSQMFSYSHVARIDSGDTQSARNLRQLSNELNHNQQNNLSALFGHIVAIIPDSSELYVATICPVK